MTDSVTVEELVREKTDLTENLAEQESIFTYQCADVTRKTVLGTYYDEIKDGYGSYYAKQFGEEKAVLVKVSDYNKMAALYHLSSF